MIYGWNFNSTDIPAPIKRRFARRVRIAYRQYAMLQGVAQSEEERDAMLCQATNGHRLLHVEERRTAGGTWYGIYVY